MRNTIGRTKVVPGPYRHLNYSGVAVPAMPASVLVINSSKDSTTTARGDR